MRYIAEKHLKDVAKPAEPLPRPKDIINWLKKRRYALFLGSLSIALYSLLYVFNIDLTHIAQATHDGNKTWFFVPIVIALVFSLVHGSFTSQFWEALGVRAKKNKLQ